MENNMVITIINLAILILSGFLTWQRSRHQNTADDSQALNNMSEVVQKLTEQNLKLQKNQAHLEDLMNNKNYSITVVFSLGEEPEVHSVTIKPVEIIKKLTKPLRVSE